MCYILVLMYNYICTCICVHDIVVDHSISSPQLLPAGYDGSLENESYPTSDEEEEPDEDESGAFKYLSLSPLSLSPLSLSLSLSLSGYVFLSMIILHVL